MRPILLLSLIACITAFLLAGWLGGAQSPWDRAVIESATIFRQPRPGLTTVSIWWTQLGGAFVLLPLMAVAGALTWFRGHRGQALWLVGSVLGGRLLIELTKWWTDRPRPSFDAHPVTVLSQAFPSGHAGNSMITYLAIALFAVPDRWRKEALGAAILLSLSIGATRPFLGVHWPTDVIGGWALGAAWMLAAWRLAKSRVRTA
ncbi:phosphatase PAP2 family protein [Sphingomonas arenae]|uniref:phosphatase PAP2 family protein n=1 Tax=Sphingomonas arenae TaxID=2812555 RepID=UPI0019678C04|nr:phosphatase PAP2 family protein [Sphingomonas arenae]